MHAKEIMFPFDLRLKETIHFTHRNTINSIAIRMLNAPKLCWLRFQTDKGTAPHMLLVFELIIIIHFVVKPRFPLETN